MPAGNRTPHAHLRLHRPLAASGCADPSRERLAMKDHVPRRSWWLLGAWRCSCGRKVLHPMLASSSGRRLSDGDAVPFDGYRRAADALAKPRNQGAWP